MKLKKKLMLKKLKGLLKVIKRNKCKKIKLVILMELILKSSLTPKIITRFYSPPEILLLEKIYTYSIDIWGLGCIIGEMLLKKLGLIQPLIPGDSSFFISPNEIE